MTDEQIKQNAEEYAEANKVNFSEDKNFDIYDDIEQKEAYIAGAHSRDEEIIRLSAEIEDDNYVISKLRNPWISVKERLPEEGVDNISIPVVAITNIGYWFKGQYDYNNKDWFFSEDSDHLGFLTDEFVTHWMHIPELKKGK